MPKQSIDFSKTVIYKIQHKELDDLLYVGSTTEYVKRKNRHKTTSYANDTNKNYNLKLYKTIRDNGGWDAFNMVIVKPFPCENRRQAEAEEDRVMRDFHSSLNMKRSYLTPENRREYFQEYYLKNQEKIKHYYMENQDKILERKHNYYMENQDKIKEKQKHYYIENIDKFKEKHHEYYIENIDKITERNHNYYMENQDKFKEKGMMYYRENQDKRIEYSKQYRLENQDKINEKFECPCGGRYTYKCKNRHFQTKLHQNFLKNNP